MNNHWHDGLLFIMATTMALLCPSTLPSIRQDSGLYRELDVIERLQLSLSEGYEIFHSVGLHTLVDGYDRYGEIDVVVLGPTGNILLIEVKAGDVILHDGNLCKIYQDNEHDIGRQCRIQHVLTHKSKNTNEINDVPF